MRCSNMENGLRMQFTRAEIDEINDKVGMVNFWTIKQTSPLEFMLVAAEEGQGVQMSEGYGYGDFVTGMLIKADRPKTLSGRSWGMGDVKSLVIVRNGIKFEPDMAVVPIKRARATDAERVHLRAAVLEDKDEGALMSLREFTTAVDRVNRFVTENEGHVVLEIRNGMLKFLVEG